MGSYLKITDWAEEGRPREKLIQKGKSSLSDAELIAILIGSGTKSKSAVDVAKEILKLSENDINELARKSIPDLIKIEGIGEAKAISIVSALELGRRRKPENFDKREIFESAKKVYDSMKAHFMDLNHEEFWLINLNRANKLISKHRLSVGGVSGTVVDPKIVYKVALENNASNIIVAHNHPSGNLKPSKSDIKITEKLDSAGKLLEINLLDHIIFTNEGYFSFSEDGKLNTYRHAE